MEKAGERRAEMIAQALQIEIGRQQALMTDQRHKLDPGREKCEAVNEAEKSEDDKASQPVRARAGCAMSKDEIRSPNE